jgi:pyruvate,water dikinase
MGRIAADLAAGRPAELIRDWHETYKHALAARIAELRGIDLRELPDDRFAAHVHGLVTLFHELHERYFRLTGAAIAVGSGLGAVCAELLGWSPQQSARLRGGLTGDHMAAVAGLTELARMAARRPVVRRWLTGPDARPERIEDTDPDFAAAFADYVRRYAHRTVGFDLTEPTLAEQPVVLLALIRAQLAQPYDFTAERAALDARIAGAMAEARSALDGRPAADRARFEAAAQAGLLASPVRDEKAYHAVSVWALLRYAVLELGRRLVARGTAERAEDALFLELPDALAALTDATDRRERIRRSRGQHAWAAANPGPPAYGGAQVAHPSASLTQGLPVEAGDADRLHGLAASPGRYLGPVRVIRDVTEFGKLRHGDVLVCPETTAQWSLLFPSVGALVTDRGSMLSHPAIIAREYGVPAVVATGAATSLLRDDQLVVVDGTTGQVQAMSDALTPAAFALDRSAT